MTNAPNASKLTTRERIALLRRVAAGTTTCADEDDLEECFKLGLVVIAAEQGTGRTAWLLTSVGRAEIEASR